MSTFQYSRDLIKTIVYLHFLRPSVRKIESRPQFKHLGVLLADVSLQAGLSYESVVVPRLKRILRDYPDSGCLDTLRTTLEAVGAEDYLNMRNRRKAGVLNALVVLLSARNIRCVGDLASSYNDSTFHDELSAIPGIGPKSKDYLFLLAGCATAPIDRHMLRVLSSADVCTKDYAYASRLLREAMLLLHEDPRRFEYEVWSLARDCAT